MLSAVLTDDQAQELVCGEENLRCAHGADRSTIRAKLARDIGISPGTIENMRRKRLKGLRATVRDRIQEWAVRGLQQEMARLENDVHLALRSGESPTGDVLIAAKAAMARARSLLDGVTRA